MVRPRTRQTAIHVLSSALVGLGLLAWGGAARPVRLLYNASASAPLGFYRVDPYAAPRRGLMMAVALPGSWARWAARRRYLPVGVLALKRVIGVPGDHVCAVGFAIFLNGHMVALRAKRDAIGRLLPHWTGCVRLQAANWFLLNAPVQSFDSRYFGPVPTQALRGAATAL